MRDFLRTLVVADFHSGHEVGLTHPGFDPDKPPKKRPECYIMRRTIWDWFVEIVDVLKPIDVLIVNGDAIDGRGPKSGSMELIYLDRQDQCDMAVAAITYVEAKTIVMSYGTAYHTGQLEDWENWIAREVMAKKIGSEDTIDVNGVLINYRHHIGRSSVPYGRHTAIAKERLQNQLWAMRGEYPEADVIVRSHVHYHAQAGGHGWTAFTTPALQGYGTRLGARRMSGTVDIGISVIDCYPGGLYTWDCPILRLPMHEVLTV